MVFFSMLFYASIAYDLERTQFIKFITLCVAAFFFTYKLIQFEKWNFKFLVVAGILMRLVFLCATPNLSQDFYRFIWDGLLINEGINPYLYTPTEIIQQQIVSLPNATLLYDGMGTLSAKHYSNYPPLNQLLFSLVTFFSKGSIMGSIIGIRVLIILSDIGILYFAKQLLKFQNRPQYLVFWYFINPLIIIELTGNLHFEGVMICLFLAALHLVSQQKPIIASILYGASICLKLIPLLFLPLFIKRLGAKRSITFYIGVAISCLTLLYVFYIPEFLEHYTQTIRLWFSNFEFNASIYNLAKHISTTFGAKPWRLIKTYGAIIPWIIIAVVALFTILKKDNKMDTLFHSMLWSLAIYYILATTVHPWYIIMLVIISIFTEYRFPIIWSAMVILSYWAYTHPEYKENLWLLTIEYSVVFGYMVYEIYIHRNKMLLFCKK